MSLKLKALGLGLLATMAMGAFAAMNASATINGHFTHNAADPHAFLIGEETFGTPHRVKFQVEDLGDQKPIECDQAVYNGTVTANTVSSVSVTPSWTQCHTEGEAPGTVTVHHKGCNITFHSRSAASGHSPTAHATVTICPNATAIEITHPNCTITVPKQNPTAVGNGVTYTPDGTRITLNSTVTFNVQFHGGICIFLGTSHIATMNGSATVRGTNTAGGAISIAAT